LYFSGFVGIIVVLLPAKNLAHNRRVSGYVFLTHLLRWWIAVAEIIIYAKSVDRGTEVYRAYNSHLAANPQEGDYA